MKEVKTKTSRGGSKAARERKQADEIRYIVQLIDRRTYSAYTKGRKTARETYEEPVTKREWWRQFVKETPVPGAYSTRDFLDVAAMNPVQASYNFGAEGRQRETGVSRNGELLLPGAYQHRDFLYDLEKRRSASSFKSSGRSREPPGFKDKDLDVTPWQYELIRSPVEKLASKHSAFKSQSTRFPSPNFMPKEGPPPGAYNPCQPSYKYPISSSFRSQTKRFGTSHKKVPGPGMYETMLYTPSQNKNLQRMARMQGLYFKNTFEV